MYLDEVHGYGDNHDDDDQPSGLSYSAWTRDKDIVRQLLSEPDAHDPVKPPDIYEMFDGPNPRLAGRTRWGNGFGAPQLDENGEYIDPDALVEKWKVRYYEFRREQELRASDPINPNAPYSRDSDNRPSGLSREAWRKDKRIIKRLLREPGAHDLVDPPNITTGEHAGGLFMFDGSEWRSGATFWGNGVGAPRFDEDGNMIPREKRVEQWKVKYYQFRRRRDRELIYDRLKQDDYDRYIDNHRDLPIADYNPEDHKPFEPRHGGRRYDEELGRWVSTNPRVNHDRYYNPDEQSGDNYYNAKNTYDRIFRRMYPEGRDYDGD